MAVPSETPDTATGHSVRLETLPQSGPSGWHGACSCAARAQPPDDRPPDHRPPSHWPHASGSGRSAYLCTARPGGLCTQGLLRDHLDAFIAGTLAGTLAATLAGTLAATTTSALCRASPFASFAPSRRAATSLTASCGSSARPAAGRAWSPGLAALSPPKYNSTLHTSVAG